MGRCQLSLPTSLKSSCTWLGESTITGVESVSPNLPLAAYSGSGDSLVRTHLDKADQPPGIKGNSRGLARFPSHTIYLDPAPFCLAGISTSEKNG